MKYTLLMLLYLSSLFASDIEFDINSYEPISYKTTKIIVDGALGSEYEKEKDSESQPTVTSTSGGIRLAGYLSREIISSDREIDFGFNTFNNWDGEYKEFKHQEYTRDNTVFSTRKNGYFEYKHYFVPQKLFISGKFSTELNYDITKYFNLMDSLKRNSYSFQGMPSAYIGYGKVIDVTYPAIAEKVLTLINKSGKYKDGSVHELAQYIEKLKRTRSFDTREKEKADIKSLVRYLETRGFSTKLSVDEIVEITELWQYGFNQNRSSGIDIGAGANYLYKHRYSYAKKDSYYKYMNAGSYSEITRMLSSNTGINITLSTSIVKEKLDTYSNFHSSPISTKQTLFWYPSLRIELQATNHLYVNRSYTNRLAQTAMRSQSIANRLNGTLKYYVLPRLYWNLEAEMNISKNTYYDNVNTLYHIKNSDKRRYSHQFNLSINYKIK